MLKRAIEAHRAGLCVLPPREDGSKRPVESWQQYQHKRPSEEKIREWYANDRCGLGVVCGSSSGDLEALDFDDREIYDRFRIRAIEANLSDLVERIEAGYRESSPSGTHLLYRCADARSKKLAHKMKAEEDRNSEHDLTKTLIETKGEGGFLITAPSRGKVHPSGKPYTLLSGGFESIVSITPQEREDLLSVARSFDEILAPSPSGQFADRRKTAGQDRPGDDYNQRTTWDQVLSPNGWQIVFQRSEVSYWRRPGKNQGLSATTNHAGSDLFYCFSTSTTLDARRSYDKFGAYAALNHSGDLAAAATDLSRQGFGRSNSVAPIPNDWDQPVEFDADTCGPDAPLEAFPEPISLYIREVSCNHQLPEGLVAGTALGVLAASCAQRAEVAIGQSHKECLGGFFLPTAASGERKGQAIRSLVFPVHAEEQRLIQVTKKGIMNARQRRAIEEKRIEILQKKAAKEEDPTEREALIREAVNLEAELTIVPATPQFTIDDSTPEAIIQALAQQNQCIAVISEEAGTLVAMMSGRYKTDTDIDVYLKGYDGGQIRVDRISRNSILLERPVLTIVTTPQPSVLDKIAENEEFRGRGLLARMCFVLPESRVGTRLYKPEGVSHEIKLAYGAAISSLLRMPVQKTLRTLRIEGEALRIWAQYADALEIAQADGCDLATMRDWASKHAGRAARIAAWFHLLRHRGTEQAFGVQICVEDMLAAWAIADWLLAHAKVAFDRMGSDPATRQARKYLGWIRRQHLARFKLKDLHDNYRSLRSPEDALPALKILEGRGFIRTEPSPPKKGPGRRPSTVFTVNPQTHTQNTQRSAQPSQPTNFA